MDNQAASVTSIIGSAGNDVLRGDASSWIEGRAGADSIFGGASNDKIYGGTGNDTITGNGGSDWIDGGDGNDSITAGTGSDQVYGGIGNDIINAGDGNNIVYGDEDNDTITVGTGSDQVYGGTGNDTITTGAGNDYIDAGAGNDYVVVGANLTINDTIIGGPDTDLLSVDSGAGLSATNVSNVSQFEGLKFTGTSAAQDLFYFTIGVNPLTSVDSAVTGQNLALTNAPTSLTDLYISQNNAGFDLSLARLVDTGANALNVTLTGAGGNLLNNLTINDEETVTLNSWGTGQHTITGTLSATDLTKLTIDGFQSLTIDTLTAPLTSLTIDSSANVTITKALSSTVITTIDAWSSGGNVTVDASNSTKDIVFTGGFGNAKITTGSGNDFLSWSWGNDTLDGGPGNDTIYGDLGNDSLTGGLGNDSIFGDAGTDLIIGGAGGDTLTGGTGNDVFQIAKLESVLGNLDIITDYSRVAGNTDTINLSDVGAVAGTANTVVNYSAAANIQAAIDAAANVNVINNGLTVFLFGGNTYAYVEVASAVTTYVPTDWVVQITGQPFAAGTAIAGIGIDGV